MYALASTTVAIMRGTTTNAWGDVVDDDSVTPVATGVLASLAITNTTRNNPDSQDIRTLRTYSCAMQSDVDVRETDRLLDERTGRIYVVESVTAPPGPALTADLDLVLSLVS